MLVVRPSQLVCESVVNGRVGCRVYRILRNAHRARTGSDAAGQLDTDGVEFGVVLQCEGACVFGACSLGQMR